MLKAILPETISVAQIVSTNVTDNDAPAWSAGTTYALTNRVVYNGAVYESSADGNTGNTPGSDGAPWLFVYVANSSRPFDRRLTAPVTKAGTIEFLIAPASLVRAVALVGVSASQATVRVRDSDGTILAEETKFLADYSEMIDALTMVLTEPGVKDMVVFEGAICAPGNRVEVVIGNGSGSPSISEIVVGDTLSIGTAIYGVGDGIDDFSDFLEDEWGNVDIVEKGYRDVKDFPVKVDVNDRPRVMRKLKPFRAKMIFVYTDPENDNGLNIYGRYERLNTIIPDPALADMNLRLLGATYAA